jgi:hypothetical protein
MITKYLWLPISFLLIGCQATLSDIGQDHAKEVTKWKELSRYAGNELKHLGLTVTAGVQINENAEGTTYSIVDVRLDRDADTTEIDLLSPEFAEKFACGEECQKLGLYDSNFGKQETQLTSFFYTEEGRFFEFYGRLTRLNEVLADYRTTSPAVLDKYLTLMLNRALVFDSLADFIKDLEVHITEEKLLAFSGSGFISPVSDRSSSTFLEDVIASFPSDFQNDNLTQPGEDWQVDNSEMPGNDWQINDSAEPSEDWQLDDSKRPSDDWIIGESREPSDDWGSNGLIPSGLLAGITQGLTTSNSSYQSWDQARQYMVQVGSIACSFSDNRFGVVKAVDANNVTLEVIAQARVVVDGMKLYPQAGHLFTAADSFYFVKGLLEETYPLSDIATCNVEHLQRGQG